MAVAGRGHSGGSPGRFATRGFPIPTENQVSAAEPSREGIERELLAVVRERLLDPETEMGPTTPLAQVGLDSMAVMQILILVEERFGVWLPESGLTRENLQDLRSLAGVVSASLSGAAGE